MTSLSLSTSSLRSGKYTASAGDQGLGPDTNIQVTALLSGGQNSGPTDLARLL